MNNPNNKKPVVLVIGAILVLVLVGTWASKRAGGLGGLFSNGSDEKLAKLEKKLQASEEENKATKQEIANLRGEQTSLQTQMEQTQLEQKNLASGVAQTAKGLKETNSRLEEVESVQQAFEEGLNHLNAGQDQIIGRLNQLGKQVELNNKSRDENDKKRDAQATEMGKTLNSLNAKIENGNQKMSQMYQEQLAQAARQEEATKTRMAVTIDKTEVNAYKDKNNGDFPMLRAILGFTTWNAGKKGLVAVPCIKTDPGESAPYHVVGGSLQSVYPMDSTQSFNREFALPLQISSEIQRYWIAIKFFDANDKDFTRPIGTTQWVEAPSLPGNSKDTLPTLKRNRNG